MKKNVDKYKNLSLDQYLHAIRLYVKELINTFIGYIDAWKTQVASILLFISSKDTDGERDMYLKSEKDTVITSSNTNDLLKTIFGSLLTEHRKKIFKKYER